MKIEPIAQGWNAVIDNAPTAKERAQAAEGPMQMLFFGGAIWIWELYCSLDDDRDTIEAFTTAIETEIAAFRAKHPSWDKG